MLSVSRSKHLQWLTSASLKKCTQIHAQMIIAGTVIHRSVITNLLRSLTDPDNGDLAYALAVFRQIPKPSTFQWNTLIRACSRNQVPQESIALYRKMCQQGVVPDVYTFQFLFKACAQSSLIREGVTVHGNFLKLFEQSDVYTGNSLINMYSEFQWIDIAKKIFDQMDLKNVVSWTTIVGVYAKIGSLDEARRLFDRMPERNVVSWTSMVAGYAQIGQAEEAVGFFRKMISADIKPDIVAIISVLSACAHLCDLDLGKWAHQFVKRELGMTRNLAVALIDMYAKCGDIDTARRVFNSMDQMPLAAWNAIIDGYCKLGELGVARSLFDQMDCQDLITFNTMMTGYIQGSNFKETLLLFSKLKASGLKPDNFMIVSLLTACANLGALHLGRALHAYIEESSVEGDVFVGTALLDMYSKCGRIDQAMQIFNRMPKKDVLTWTAMITGLAIHGDGKSALAHFLLMQEDGIMPNQITYIGVLSGCSHSGLVEEGFFYFNEMKSVYKMEPKIEHYGCMVDLLGRSGYLKEAEEIIQSMPMEANAVIWSSLLSSCRVYNNAELAENAAKHLLVLEPHEDTVYVLLYNIYASSGRWANAAKIRSMMEDGEIKKTAGCSSIMEEGNITSTV